MVDYKKISDFQAANSYGDDDLLLVSQAGITKKMPGAVLRDYNEQTIAPQVEAAAESANEAQTAADEAKQAAETAANEAAVQLQPLVDRAEIAATNAENAANETAGAVRAELTELVEQAETAAEDAEKAADETATAVRNELTELVERAETASDEAVAAKEALDALEVSAETVSENTPARIEQSIVDGHQVWVFYIPQGGRGLQGLSIAGIEKTAGTGAPGTADTYDIILSDGSRIPGFQVYNGKDGQGSGDMSMSVYDKDGNGIVDEAEYAANAGKLGGISPDAFAMVSSLGALATKNTVTRTDLTTDVQNSLSKAETALQSFTENDPTVPEWAKQPNKPSYSASDVGADPAGTAASVGAAVEDSLKQYVDDALSSFVNVAEVGM